MESLRRKSQSTQSFSRTQLHMAKARAPSVAGFTGRYKSDWMALRRATGSMVTMVAPFSFALRK